jgi:hypothetical protein
MWRSATFQSVMSAVKSGQAEHLSRMHNENIKQCTVQMTNVLHLASSGFDKSGVQDLLLGIAETAAEVAFQFGIQPATLQLSIPHSHQQVVIGDEYHDCIDADSFRGAGTDVELVVSPGVIRLGDGRANMNSRISLVPCQIYAAALGDD